MVLRRGSGFLLGVSGHFSRAKLPPKFFLPSCKLDWGQNRWQHYLRPGTKRVAALPNTVQSGSWWGGIGYSGWVWVGPQPNLISMQLDHWKKGLQEPLWCFVKKSSRFFTTNGARTRICRTSGLKKKESISSNFIWKGRPPIWQVPMRFYSWMPKMLPREPQISAMFFWLVPSNNWSPSIFAGLWQIWQEIIIQTNNPRRQGEWSEI